MKRKVSAVLFVTLGLVFFLFTAVYAAPNKSKSQWKPSVEISSMFDYEKDFQEFKKSYGPKYYGKENIFNYINGGAQAYLNLGFKEVIGFELEDVSDGDNKFVVDVYNMSNLSNAKKIFTKEKSGSPATIEGRLKGDISGNQVRFHKNKYYVKVTAFKDVPGKVLIKLAAIISGKMKDR